MPIRLFSLYFYLFIYFLFFYYYYFFFLPSPLSPLLKSFPQNSLASSLAVFNIALYGAIYTPLKKIHWFNTWIGSVVGAIPPMIGWAAKTNNLEVFSFFFFFISFLSFFLFFLSFFCFFFLFLFVYLFVFYFLFFCSFYLFFFSCISTYLSSIN